jgi:hypothetical protein
MFSMPIIPLDTNPSVKFGTKIRFENPEIFKREFEDNQALCNQTNQSSPYQSPNWQRFERLCTANRNSAQPVSCYPWGKNSIRQSTDIYTGAMITGTGGGITDGTTGIRFHFDRQPENLAELEKPLQAVVLNNRFLNK